MKTLHFNKMKNLRFVIFILPLIISLFISFPAQAYEITQNVSLLQSSVMSGINCGSASNYTPSIDLGTTPRCSYLYFYSSTPLTFQQNDILQFSLLFANLNNNDALDSSVVSDWIISGVDGSVWDFYTLDVSFNSLGNGGALVKVLATITGGIGSSVTSWNYRIRPAAGLYLYQGFPNEYLIAGAINSYRPLVPLSNQGIIDALNNNANAQVQQNQNLINALNQNQIQNNQNSQQIVNSVNNMKTEIQTLNDGLLDKTDPNVDASSTANTVSGLLPPGPIDGMLASVMSLFIAPTQPCSPIQLPLPFVGGNLPIPCISTLLPPGIAIVAIIINGVVLWRCVTFIINRVRGLTDTDDNDEDVV